jgi:hypothetical protein
MRPNGRFSAFPVNEQRQPVLLRREPAFLSTFSGRARSSGACYLSSRSVADSDIISAQGREELRTREMMAQSGTMYEGRGRTIDSRFHRKNSCYSRTHRSILEQSQGDNSHQSETNLIERPLKQHLPGTPTFFPFAKEIFSFAMILDSENEVDYSTS